METRTAAKALILKDGAVLLIKHKTDQVYYTLAGGGQDHNEDLVSCLKRECIEEIGHEVQVNDLAFVYEYRGDFEDHPVKGYHQIDMIFSCDLGPYIGKPEAMDDSQIGHEWVALQDLMSLVVYPMSLRNKILDLAQGKSQAVYFSNP